MEAAVLMQVTSAAAKARGFPPKAFEAEFIMGVQEALTGGQPLAKATYDTLSAGNFDWKVYCLAKHERQLAAMAEITKTHLALARNSLQPTDMHHWLASSAVASPLGWERVKAAGHLPLVEAVVTAVLAPKRHCLLFHGKPDTGKSYFIRALSKFPVETV